MSKETLIIRATKQTNGTTLVQCGDKFEIVETGEHYEYEGLQYIWRIGDDDGDQINQH